MCRERVSKWYLNTPEYSAYIQLQIQIEIQDFAEHHLRVVFSTVTECWKNHRIIPKFVGKLRNVFKELWRRWFFKFRS